MIEVDANYITVDPTTINPADPANRGLYPVGWGLLVHEIAHAEHTRWGFGDRDHPIAAQMATMLDEARIEGRRATTTPADRQWLRAASLHLDLDALHAPDSPASAAKVAALLLARADAGILTHGEVAPVRKAVVAVLGRRRLRRLEWIWRRALRTADDDTAAMMEWGHRWCRIMAMHSQIPFPVPSSGAVLLDAVTQVLAGIADEVAICIAAAIREIREAQKKADKRAEGLSADKRKKAAGERVFGRRGARLPTAQLGETRPPTETEKIAARTLARELKKAARREPATVKITTALPPGRLVPRAAMAEAVQRSLGQIPTAQPWSSNARRLNPQPPLLLGISIDVSVSMGAFFGPAASITWIITKAVGLLPGGASASVTFGEEVQALTVPGRRPSTEVQELLIEDDTLGFPLTIDALDYALGLSTEVSAARLLVMITDGGIGLGERIAAQHRLDLLAQGGCALLWIGPPESRPLAGPQVVLLADATQAGALITKAAVNALRNRG
ncbi:hypothetical protein [Longispora urticae]